MGMPSSILKIVPSVEPGTPPQRAGRPVALRTAPTIARTSGSVRSTRVARRKPLTGVHSTLTPGHASAARRHASSISLPTVSASGPGVSRTSSVACAVAGITFDCGTPATGAAITVGVTVGGRRYRLRAQSARRRRAKRRGRPRGGLALGHDVGLALEQERRARGAVPEARQHVGTAGRDVLYLDVEALCAHPALDVTGDGGFVGARIVGADHAGM